METKNSNYTYQSVIQLDDEVTASRKFLAKVFLWMFAGLVISAGVSYVFATDVNLLQLIVGPTGLTGLGTVIMFSPLAFSLVMSFGYTRISYPVLMVLFLAYSVVIGISLSILALVYTGTTLATVFGVSALIYGIMAVAGYTTQTDLTKFGNIMIMGMFAIVGASLINYFIGSSSLDYIISFVGVAVFTGLTAFYVQMLKRIGEGVEFGSAEQKKLVIIGAFVLYTNFINLFLSLLRVFGGGSRRN